MTTPRQEGKEKVFADLEWCLNAIKREAYGDRYWSIVVDLTEQAQIRLAALRKKD